MLLPLNLMTIALFFKYIKFITICLYLKKYLIPLTCCKFAPSKRQTIFLNKKQF